MSRTKVFRVHLPSPEGVRRGVLVEIKNYDSQWPSLTEFHVRMYAKQWTGLDWESIFVAPLNPWPQDAIQRTRINTEHVQKCFRDDCGMDGNQCTKHDCIFRTDPL